MARAREAVLIDTVGVLVRDAAMPVTAACALLGVPRSSYYRRTRGYRHYVPVTEPVPHVQRRQPAALSDDERARIVELILAEENTDLSVVQVYWRSFDAGFVACSESTFYRVARAQNLTGDRRRTRRATAAARRAPVARAGRAGQLWSWDITMLHGPRKQDRYLLYLVMDVFSRFPVAWRIEYAEVPELAVQMFAEAFEAFGVPRWCMPTMVRRCAHMP
ncbi:DDE-type integrase/transposase/recombinase [Rhodococcus sp. USK10]|uniref:DDE-type integrase/transposase/recombinase n=1 Tax=Rhodococcus sp. USK10 TaxID=2789739 RepID=UPI001C601F0A|nr:DDE-type integrase/transposase/recombinase [Rhodococcus sp. USK10]QYB06541.1 DDE-type integrase/transposase/recombinase [Rhodococcus sp. USK10]